MKRNPSDRDFKKARAASGLVTARSLRVGDIVEYAGKRGVVTTAKLVGMSGAPRGTMAIRLSDPADMSKDIFGGAFPPSYGPAFRVISKGGQPFVVAKRNPSIPIREAAFHLVRHGQGWPGYRLVQRRDDGAMDKSMIFWAPNDIAARAYVPKATFDYAVPVRLERAKRAATPEETSTHYAKHYGVKSPRSNRSKKHDRS